MVIDSIPYNSSFLPCRWMGRRFNSQICILLREQDTAKCVLQIVSLHFQGGSSRNLQYVQ